MEEPKNLIVYVNSGFARITTSSDEFLASFESEDARNLFLKENYKHLLFSYQRDKARKELGEAVPFLEDLRLSSTYWRQLTKGVLGRIPVSEIEEEVKLFWEQQDTASDEGAIDDN